MINHSIDSVKNKQTNIQKEKKIFVSVSKSHDDVGYLLDHSVSSSPQRPRLCYTIPMANPSIDAVTNKQWTNNQTNKHTKRRIFVSVSKSHDDVGYLLDHSVSSSPQRPRLRCTLPFLWPTMYGCCSMYQAWYVVLFFFKAVHLALNSFPWWWRYIYPFSPHRFTVIWN